MKALEILKNCRERGQKRAGGLELDEAIAELEEAQLTRREWYQKGYAEAMKPKTCDGCKWNVQVGDVGNFHCWKSRELHYCQANGFIDYCNEFEPKDNA